MTARWWLGLLRGSAVRSHVVAPGSAGDDMVIQDALQIRRSLNALSRNQDPVALQGPDGQHAGHGLLRTNGAHGVVVVVLSAEPGLSPDTQSSLNATVSGEHGLLFFTLHGLSPLAAGLLQAPWPDTLIRVQSRRHFRVSDRMDGLSITLPGSAARAGLRNISEEGIGLWLDHSDWPPGNIQQLVQLHLDALVLPVPALQRVHGGPGVWTGSGQPAGARLVGMAAEHVRQLRCWLAARQAASLTPLPDQA